MRHGISKAKLSSNARDALDNVRYEGITDTEKFATSSTMANAIASNADIQQFMSISILLSTLIQHPRKPWLDMSAITVKLDSQTKLQPTLKIIWSTNIPVLMKKS